MEASNVKAMREALNDIADICDGKKGQSTSEERLIIYNLAKVALSVPPRNCDVGTAKEQAKRFQDFCDDSQTDEDFCSMCARCSLKKERHCELAWAQMPYEAEEGDDDGGKQ